MGALLHAPWHSTSTTVNFPSSVVSPGCMPPRWLHTVLRISVEPRSIHGVVVQTCTKCSPMGSLQALVKDNIAFRHEKHVPVEHCVKSSDFIDPHWWHSQQVRHVVHHADARPSLVLALSQVEEWYDCSLLVLWGISGDDFVCSLLVLAVKLERNLKPSQ